MKAYREVSGLLNTLKLQGVQNHLDELITEAETQKQSYVSFLNEVLNYELAQRAERRRRRNISGAHFPVTKRIEDFDFNLVKGISKTEVSQLLDFSWIDKNENVLFFGYTPIEKREANLFFNLVSEMYEKQPIILTSNKSFSEWAEMMGDEVMMTAMLDRLLHQHVLIVNN